MTADAIDYGEWKTGVKAEGVGMAGVTIMTKIANGLAGVIIGWLIELGTYDATAAVQSSKAVLFLKAGYLWIPLICLLISIVFLAFYKLDKLYPQIQKELTERRNLTV